MLMLIVAVACGAGPYRSRTATGPQLFPGVNGPGPGVIPARGGAAGMEAGMPAPSAQLAFQGLEGMMISWDIGAIGAFDSEPRVTPFAQNFEMGKIYRLRISNLPNREGKTYYPTVKINAMTPRTRSYLEHNAVPVKFTDTDIDQVDAGNFVTKVIFLPAPEFQNIAVAGGVDTIVNTQLPAGSDPIVEAQNRGAVLAVVQIGNKDLALPNSYQGEGMIPGATDAAASGQVPQIPISGVNVPAFGTPNTVTPYGIPGPPVLPSAPEGVKSRSISPVNPMPATEIPRNQDRWSGKQF